MLPVAQAKIAMLIGRRKNAGGRTDCNSCSKAIQRHEIRQLAMYTSIYIMALTGEEDTKLSPQNLRYVNGLRHQASTQNDTRRHETITGRKASAAVQSCFLLTY
jgi:hypothetical protein